MKAQFFFYLLLITSFLYSQNNSEFDKLPSGIYFKDGNQITALDPTLVNFTKKGNSIAQAYGFKAKSIGELIGREANYLVKSDVKFYFKFKPEEKELNSSNANATNKVGEENYINILMSGTNTKAISPNEFKLVRLKIKKGKRTYFAGKYSDVLGLNINYSLKSEQVFDFKYKKIGENLFEVNFPMGIISGEYCFVYLDNSKSNLDYLNTNNNTKVFDFSVH
jgi:hypothetical protein